MDSRSLRFLRALSLLSVVVPTAGCTREEERAPAYRLRSDPASPTAEPVAAKPDSGAAVIAKGKCRCHTDLSDAATELPFCEEGKAGVVDYRGNSCPVRIKGPLPPPDLPGGSSRIESARA